MANAVHAFGRAELVQQGADAVTHGCDRALIGWPTARFLSALAELKVNERARWRIERDLAEARLPPGKSFDNIDFTAVPILSKAHLMALASGDTWIENASTPLPFGPPGCGKTHASAALGRALIENGYRVLYMRTTDLVQRLKAARQTLHLEQALVKLDRFDLLILNNLTHVTKDQAEMSVLFELIASGYERRSLLITANMPFGEWNWLVPDPAMTVAAIDLLVYHVIVLEGTSKAPAAAPRSDAKSPARNPRRRRPVNRHARSSIRRPGFVTSGSEVGHAA